MPAIPQLPSEPQSPLDVRPQTTYPNVVMDLQPLPDGNLVLIVQTPATVLLFPMGAAYAAELGKKLTAPHIVPAHNGHGPPSHGGRP